MQGVHGEEMGTMSKHEHKLLAKEAPGLLDALLSISHLKLPLLFLFSR